MIPQGAFQKRKGNVPFVQQNNVNGNGNMNGQMRFNSPPKNIVMNGNGGSPNMKNNNPLRGSGSKFYK